MLEWNIYYGDFNNRKIKVGNIFDNTGFVKDCEQAYKKFKDNKEEFLERVRLSLMYYYWCKCEWEVVIDHWPHRDDFVGEKVDVYDQIMLNWPVFSEYIWNNREEFKKRRKV